MSFAFGVYFKFPDPDPGLQGKPMYSWCISFETEGTVQKTGWNILSVASFNLRVPDSYDTKIAKFATSGHSGR